MSEPRLISPLLDNFVMGDPISDRNGVRCCPAMNNNTGNKYIVKIISSPASSTQLEALILSGAYATKEDAQGYYKLITDGIEEEIGILQKLSKLEGYLPLENYQIVPMEDNSGFDVYMLSQYRNTLDQKLRHSSMTHLEAINLGLDMCAALAVCRRSGYLYTNLKPENIYLADEKGYRIGDIGFVGLNSLKYNSLPDRNRSSYTAPEIADAFASLNTTMDTYALGLILYQVFNDGALPSVNDEDPDAAIAPPAYADYEMAEIILKACAVDPAARWSDPIEMGQALISYMQRNGANDTPIAPVVEEPEIVPEIEIKQEEPETQEIDPENITEEHIYTEDDQGNLTILEDENIDETAPEEADVEIDSIAVTDEVNAILSQADDLLAHPTPDPVIQPEAIDVPIPESLPIEENDEESDEEASDSDEETEEAEEQNTETEEPEAPIEEPEEIDDEGEENEEAVPAKKTHWGRNIFLVFLVLACIAAGFLFYTRYYLQPIDSIEVDEGKNCSITVNVKSGLDESKLIVVCSDTYGNQLRQSVKDGKAIFTDLTPNAAYTVKVVTDGFHKLTGDTSAAFTTPVQTNIVQLNAVTGSEDGSMVVGFTIEGPDAKQWNIAYQAADEEQKTISFAGHMVTVTGLTVGKEYNITLSPAEDLLITGITQMKHTASAIIKPVDLQITGIIDGKLTATWAAPANTTVESWTVRCYNDKGYDKTIVASETTATFDEIDSTTDYTVEVTAAGMSVNARTFAPANSITVTELKADLKNDNDILFSWNSNGNTPKNGWVVLYSISGSPTKEIACKEGTSVTIPVKVPGSVYSIKLETADGAAALGGIMKVEIPEANEFSDYNLKKSNLTFKMCKTPSKSNWDKDDLSSKDYTTTFAANGKASFLVKSSKTGKSSSEKVTTLFVIRDENGSVVNFGSTTTAWRKMWSNRYCELNIPALPGVEGKYTISVYFNGALAHEQSFEISR